MRAIALDSDCGSLGRHSLFLEALLRRFCLRAALFLAMSGVQGLIS